jgi:hypothetical protein
MAPAANDSLVTAHVIGDVLDPFYTAVDMMILFGGAPIISGMELRAQAVSDRPRVEIGGEDYRDAYTLVINSLVIFLDASYLVNYIHICLTSQYEI